VVLFPLPGNGLISSGWFAEFHSKKVLDKTAKPMLVGPVAEAAKL